MPGIGLTGTRTLEDAKGGQALEILEVFGSAGRDFHGIGVAAVFLR